MKQREKSKEVALSTGISSNEREASRVRIEYLSSQGSRISRDDKSYSEDYIKKLEILVLKY